MGRGCHGAADRRRSPLRSRVHAGIAAKPREGNDASPPARAGLNGGRREFLFDRCALISARDLLPSFHRPVARSVAGPVASIHLLDRRSR
jgi:hypothetical protein